MEQLAQALISGLALAAPMFLGASGLALIFGVMHTLDFSYGALFMIGAYVTATVLGGASVGLITFAGAVLVAAIVAAGIAGGQEYLVFRRMGSSDRVMTLLASFALLFILAGLTIMIWGPAGRSQAAVKSLEGSILVVGARVATYDLVLIVVAAVVGLALWFLLARSRLGLEIRAVAHDRPTAAAMGIRSARVGSSVFLIGGGLAGLAGGLSAPLYAINTGLASTFILQIFVIVIIGGLGSITGTLVASLIVGVANGLFVYYAPSMAAFSLYAVTIIVLLIRPQGLFGAKEKVAA